MSTQPVIYITDTCTYAAGISPNERGPSESAPLSCPVAFPDMPRDRDDLVPFGRGLGEWVAERAPGGFTCTLVIPSNWCFIEQVVLTTDKWSEQTALFEFERSLPVELEQLTCGVLKLDSTTAVVVGVFTQPVLGLFRELERHGVFCETATVDGLLLRGACRNGTTTDQAGAALIDSQRVVLAVPRSEGKTDVAIRTFSLRGRGGADTLVPQLATTLASAGSPGGRWTTLSVAQDAATDGVVQAVVSLGCQLDPVSQEESIERILGAATAGPSPFDLRCGALAYAGRWKPVQMLSLRVAVTLALLLLVTAVGARFRGISYSESLEQLQAAKAEIYRDVFPHQPPPPGAALRLRSERIKLEGLTETGKGDARLLQSTGIENLALLSRVITQIPARLKLHVDEITVDERALKLVGRTTEHSAAGQLVQRFNGLGLLEVAPPRTKLRDDGTVDFRIQADRIRDDQPDGS